MPTGQLDIVLYSQAVTLQNFEGDGFNIEQPSPAPPTVERMQAADFVLVIGPLQDGSLAMEIGGSIRLALERGATAVFLYQARPGPADQRLLKTLGQPTGREASGTVVPVLDAPEPDSAFREYLVAHGHMDALFSGLPEEAEGLAHAKFQRTAYPCAFVAAVGDGRLYVLPFHIADGAAMPMLFGRLVGALTQHRGGGELGSPAFFDELNVEGEVEIAATVEDLADKLAAAKGKHGAVIRHKELVGHWQADPFALLVIDELNLVLAGSGVEARPIEKGYVEDFDLAREEDPIALGEAKGVNRGIGLADVNQANHHRTELLDKSAEELAGLLVVNAHRLKDDLAMRTERVHERVVRHARRMNVLVLRGWDLYQLVNRRLRGEDDGQALVAALEGGGGWLEVTGEGLHVHAG